MNKKQWIVAGIIFVILLVIGLVVHSRKHLDDTVLTFQGVPVLELVYCSEESAKPCVVSFSTDTNENMLVNIILPDMSFPIFYLEIDHGGEERIYNCQRVRQANVIAYCSGKKLPPGEILHLMLVSTRDSVVLAEGDLSIIGLEFPTLAVVSLTPEFAVPVPTEQPMTETPASSPTQFQELPPPRSTPTSTEKPSYPNPSYPNPSYPNPSYP